MACNDIALLEAARGGDAAALEDLLKRYQDKVYNLALRFTGDAGEAEEVLQETFLKVFRNLESFRGDSAFSTWLYRIAHNEALMRQRTRRRHPEESLESLLPRYNKSGRLERLDLDYGRAASADELLEKRELREKTFGAIARLPEIYQAPLILRDMGELSTEETAEILGIKAEAVRTRLHRARLMLRGFLGRISGGEEDGN